MAWVYVARCADGSLYTGATKRDPSLRVRTHNTGLGSKYCRSRRPITLAWCERHATWSAALGREREIKRMSRGEKLALIERT